MIETKTLWSNNIDTTAHSEPKKILQQQALELGLLTKNIVTATVNTTLDIDDTEGFADFPNSLHNFDIVAPILGFKSFTLFSVKQSLVSDYPLYFYSTYWKDKGGYRICQNSADFNQSLGDILSSPKTANLINSLIAQSS